MGQILNISPIIYAKQIRPNLSLLVGSDALSLFDYYGVDQLHGLSRKECIERISMGGEYIEGMCNLIPDSKNNFYLFLNKKSFTEDLVSNYAIVFHEATHYYFEQYWNDLQEMEETLITESEVLSIDICRLIF